MGEPRGQALRGAAKRKRRPRVIGSGVNFSWTGRDLSFRFVVFLRFNSFGQIFVIIRGRADIVEQFRDFELCCGFFFRGQFLDRFACGLKFGLFNGTCDVQLNGRFDFGVQIDCYIVQAQIFDRVAQNDLLAVDCETFGCCSVGCVTCCDRTVQAPASEAERITTNC